MRTKIGIALTLFLFLIPLGWKVLSGLYAQSFAADVVGSAGAYATAPGGSLAWIIGEVTIEAYSSINNFLHKDFINPIKKRL